MGGLIHRYKVLAFVSRSTMRPVLLLWSITLTECVLIIGLEGAEQPN